MIQNIRAVPHASYSGCSIGSTRWSWHGSRYASWSRTVTGQRGRACSVSASNGYFGKKRKSYSGVQ